MTRPKRACSQSIEEFESDGESVNSNYSDNDENLIGNSNKMIEGIHQKKRQSAWIVDEKDIETCSETELDEKDIETCSESGFEDTDSTVFDSAHSIRPIYEGTVREKRNNVLELDKYWPYGLEDVNEPVNTDLLFLFKVIRDPESSFIFERFERTAYLTLFELIYIETLSIHYKKNLYRQKFKLLNNPHHESCPNLTVRKVTDEVNEAMIIDGKTWNYNILGLKEFYNAVFDEPDWISFHSPSLKIFTKNRTMAFYLRMDEASLPQTLSSITPKFCSLLQYNFLKGNMNICEKANRVITDTFDFPEAVFAPGFKLTLRDYQLRSVSWMQSIESVKTTNDYNSISHNITFRDRECIMKIKLGNTPHYIDFENRESTETPETSVIKPVRFYGGILADDTGSGKTITVLNLIHSSPLTEEKEKESALRFQFQNDLLRTRATCIVCPSNIYQQWITEAKRCNPRFKVIGLSTILNHRKISWKDAMNADIIVVSYQFLQNTNYRKALDELSRNLGKYHDANEKSEYYLKENGLVVLHKLRFHRMILDEFHELDSNKNIVQQYVESMRADYIWGLTGTPNLDSICDQLKYFNPPGRFLEVYKDNHNARVEFQRKFIKRNVPDLKLPPIQNETVWLNLTPQEMALLSFKKISLKEQIMMCTHYQLSENTTVAKEDFVSIDTAQKQLTASKEAEIVQLKRDLLSEIAQIEQILKEKPEQNVASRRTRVKDIEKRLQSTEGSYNYILNVFQLISEPDNNECRICYDKIVEEQLSILPCSHIYCYDCVVLAMQRNSQCPLCNHKLNSVAQVYRIRLKEPEVLAEQLQSVDLSKYGSKLIVLYNYLTTLLAQNQSARIILFLQYSDLADFMAESFKELDINCARVVGTVYQRQNAIAKFKESKDCRLIMLSSEDSVSGINLTEATHVILLHPFWTDQGEDVDRAYEKQGISRAYRFGLKHPLKVVRFATRGTVEEEITLRRKTMVL